MLGNMLRVVMEGPMGGQTWRNHGWSFSTSQAIQDSSFSYSLTSLHLTNASWMHPLMLNQQDQVQTSAVRK